MKIILQNKSDSTFSYLNGAVVLLPLSELDVNQKYWTALVADVSFIKDVRLNNFLVNDGITTYESPKSEEYIGLAAGSVGTLQTFNLPFANKVLPNGKKLYTRVHGISTSITQASQNIDFTIPYNACKITGIEIMSSTAGDTCNIKVLDTPTGTFSTIPNYPLNQFGFNVNIPKDYYIRESAYDADLYKDMVVRIEYTSAAQLPSNIYINFILHEVKD